MEIKITSFVKLICCEVKWEILKIMRTDSINSKIIIGKKHCKLFKIFWKKIFCVIFLIAVYIKNGKKMPINGYTMYGTAFLETYNVIMKAKIYNGFL